MIVIVSGPINAGKSAVARLLAQLQPDSLYVDGDDLAPADLPNEERWTIAIDLISMATLSIAQAGLHLFVAYPVDDESWSKIKQPLQAAGHSIACVVLAPPLDVALSNRGGQPLSEWEQARIPIMYEEGYQNPPFASLIIDNSGENAGETAQRIYDHLELN